MKDYISYAKCPVCGAVFEDVLGSLANVTCCGQKPVPLIANTTDAAVEKHVPHVEVNDGELVVKVGSVEHPMTKEHYIMWISQVYGNRENKVILSPEQSTEVRFPYMPECRIYAYCNLHGLWVKEFKA